MNWAKILKRFKGKEPTKKEIPLQVKHILGFLLEARKVVLYTRLLELIKIANQQAKDDGYFEINKNLEIEFKSYEP